MGRSSSLLDGEAPAPLLFHDLGAVPPDVPPRMVTRSRADGSIDELKSAVARLVQAGG
jgi:hypothetical protein